MIKVEPILNILPALELDRVKQEGGSRLRETLGLGDERVLQDDAAFLVSGKKRRNVVQLEIFF